MQTICAQTYTHICPHPFACVPVSALSYFGVHSCFLFAIFKPTVKPKVMTLRRIHAHLLLIVYLCVRVCVYVCCFKIIRLNLG